MTFTPINVVNGTTPANATWGNNAQTQYTEAILSFEQDLFTPFVLSGLVATKDGTTANQLDVTAGVAFLLQSDSTLRRRAPSASTTGQFTTSTPSTTYYLFLNNDGTFTWGTTSTGPANSLPICQATTDTGGNILVVTDKRGLNTTLLTSMLGQLTPPTLGNVTFVGNLVPPNDGAHGLNQDLYLVVNASPLRFGFVIGDGTGWQLPFYKQPSGGGTKTKVAAINDTGGFSMLGGQASAGSFGVPVIVAQTIRQSISGTAQQTILSFTPPANGLYEARLYSLVKNTGAATITAQVSYTNPDSGLVIGVPFVTNNTGPNVAEVSGFAAANNTDITTFPITFWASSTAAITITYRDSTNTPTDIVTAQIMRLA